MKLRLKVKTNSKEASIEEKDGYLLVRVGASAREGAANKEVINLVAKYFGVSKSEVEIVSGLKSRNKVITIKDK
ncbi:MAG: hypothetical protein COT89_02280 [Candidatus Colwellbacteria bacterium CG10_big_fil_rev_8_21_14_0_10_42_22]|uniref:Uncharacterized protein n=1 Tax=Candidatus Colwellbacteria bacterium CG10_big_fil_rev_8_21_14_0_10_42_22 TaxID=1974540 RepID=A0A2H0VFK9_9BACT|nr:MAG: hypothetical protein COT89_02280 [Candidatus Colwellbacteria bacterium CG10_big_fil_rev_8_21_14_0_10_42_22]